MAETKPFIVFIYEILQGDELAHYENVAFERLDPALIFARDVGQVKYPDGSPKFRVYVCEEIERFN